MKKVNGMVNTTVSSAVVDKLRTEYLEQRHLADRLESCLCDQLKAILDKNKIPLAVSMESRVKNLDSLIEKLERKQVDTYDISEIDDLVGIRLILLFQSDVLILDEIIKSEFEIISYEDTSSRLDETQFGYQSNHYIVRIPKSWRKVPNYHDLGGISAEIQVRTLAQHMWAAASHELQYKREASVPLPIRRTIHRVSALLETIDVEFSRVIDERSRYVEESKSAEIDLPLDVDTLKSLLDDLMPPERKLGSEDYDDLLRTIQVLGKSSSRWLRDVIKKNLAAALEKDKLILEDELGSEDSFSKIARNRGFVWNQAGLARQCLKEELGESRFNRAMTIGKDPGS